MLPIISFNGHLTPVSTPLISPFDRGFTLGDGLFETINVANGVVWYLDRHLDRLAYGAARLGIVVPSLLRYWIDDVIQRAATEGETEYVLRITMTRGVAQAHGLAGNAGQHATIVIAAFEKPHLSPTLYEHGVSVHIASARRNENAATAGLKTTSYLESVLALREANAAGHDDAMFLDTRGFVAEASASNVFVWHTGVLMTPPCTCGILPGITRAVILELAARANISTAEQEITREELYQAEEIFLTSSLRGILPVILVNQTPIGSGTPGPVTRQMMARYDSQDDSPEGRRRSAVVPPGEGFL